VTVAQEELAGCLRSWRERITPAEAGLPAGRGRRTPGLRREQVAGLAGVSLDYLARLEQGRAHSPSPSVLASLARALSGRLRGGTSPGCLRGSNARRGNMPKPGRRWPRTSAMRSGASHFIARLHGFAPQTGVFNRDSSARFGSIRALGGRAVAVMSRLDRQAPDGGWCAVRQLARTAHPYDHPAAF
jgi:hypothetical protein